MKRMAFTAFALLFAFTAAAAVTATDETLGFARNGKTLTGNFPSTGITIEAGATVTFAGVYAAYASDGKLGAVECLGDATIILAPNTRNVASNYMTCASAIFVPAGHTLTIKGEGSLEAVSVKEYCSGIGACSKWLGMDGKKGACGNIVIAGGKVTAIAGGACAAAIGAAQYKGKCGNITICGNADVTAESTFGAAAIGAAGCGGPCGDITIKDNASVKAVAGGKKGDYDANGAGIGAGNDSPCGNIVIATTGRVEATGAPGTWGGAGIGGGGFSSDTHDTAICGDITISSGTIIAKGNGDRVDRDHGNGIGCTQVSACGIIRITGGNITALGGPNAAGIGANGTNSAIFIEGGTIKAIAGELTGVRSAAAIGPSGTDSHCGDITITGGSCDLEGGPDCPGIGIARRGSSCGRITIGEGVKLLKIKRGERATDYIAAVTKDREQGIVTIAPSLSQTYSEDKSTLIIGHDATTSSASSPASASENLLCHITFDDQANPLKATVGANAIVRTGRDTVVSGLGNTKWESPSGDGALNIPNRTHIAVPVPPSLAKQPGLPYCIEMKVRFPEPQPQWCCLMNMPAENNIDAMAFLTVDADKRVVLNVSGRIEGAEKFRLGAWNTFRFQFGEKTTRVFLDGREVFKQDFTLAGSRADCSKAGGYFLFAADENGEDDQMSIADLKIYAGIAEPSGESGIGKKDVPSSTSPSSSVATSTANTPASPAGGNNGQAGGATSTNGDDKPLPGSGSKPSTEVQQTLDTFTADDGLSAAEKIPALKAYIETHLDEPGIEKLIDLLEKLAKDANDEETLKWVEEIRKKLADRKSGAPANNDTTCRYPGPQPGELKMLEPLKLAEEKRAPDYLNPDGTPVGSEQKPSAEVQQMLDTFSADDGLSAAEKIPALKAYIETHLDEPGIEKLIDLLEKLAKDANDEETLKWVEEIRKKLADKKAGGDKLGNTPEPGNPAGNQPGGVADDPSGAVAGIPPANTPAGEPPAAANPPADDHDPPATTNPPAATNPAGGEDGGKKTGGSSGGTGDEPQPGSGKKPGDDSEGYMPPEKGEDMPLSGFIKEPWDETYKILDTSKIEEPEQERPKGMIHVGCWRLCEKRIIYDVLEPIKQFDVMKPKNFTASPCSLSSSQRANAGYTLNERGYHDKDLYEDLKGRVEWSGPPPQIDIYLANEDTLPHEATPFPRIMRIYYAAQGNMVPYYVGGNLKHSVEIETGLRFSASNLPRNWSFDKLKHRVSSCLMNDGTDLFRNDGGVFRHAHDSRELTGKPIKDYSESGFVWVDLKKNISGFAQGQEGDLGVFLYTPYVGNLGCFVFYVYAYHDMRNEKQEEKKTPEGGYWHLVSNNVEQVEKSNLGDSNIAYVRASETEHTVNEDYFKTKIDRRVHPAKTEKVKVARFSFTSHCSRPPKTGLPGQKFSMRVKYSGVKNDIFVEGEENPLNYETYMSFRQYGPMRKFSLDGDCYDESRLGVWNRQKGLVAGVSTWPTKGLWAVPESKMRLNLRDNTVWGVFPEGPKGADPGRWLEVSFWDRPEAGYGVFDIAKTTWYYEWVPPGENPTETQEPPPEKPEEPEEPQQGEAMVKFAQKDMGLPANKDKFVLKSEDKKKNKVGLDEYRIPFAVLNMLTNREYTVKAGFRRMGAAGENGIYLEENAITNAIPYSVEIVKDKEHGDKGLWEAVIKETGTYELPAGTSEGILLKVVAESGKKGDKDYVSVYETFPIYRIHLGLSFILQANTIPCYLEMAEKSKFKLDKQDIAGDPEKDPDDKYVIRQEDFEVPLREGAMMLFLYDEDRADFIRIPAVPKATRVTATKVTNDLYCQTRDAEENHQELVDRLGIKAISTGKTRGNGSHVVKVGPTTAVLDPPLRLLADLEVDAVYSNRVSNFTRTFTAKKHVLLHSQPMRVFENSDDERQYSDRDAHIRKQLERIRFKIEGTCINRLFSLRNMIDRMIDGYDSRFGYDERQVKRVMETYVGFIEGRFEGANGVPYKVTFGDDLKACYAFMQGLRDNTGFLGRMAMGVLTGGVSEHVFTTMTVLENMQNEIMTCKDVNEFGFLRAVQIGGEEIGKQVLMEMIAQGAIQGAAKAANIDVNATMQMWAGKYRKAMDGADSWLKSHSSLYKAGDTALQTCKNFLGGGTKAAVNAVENVARSEDEAAKRAEELLKKSRKEMTPAELKAVTEYEEAMANGMKKVRNLQKAQQAMEDAAKNNKPALKAAKENYRKLADEVWSDKCALKKLQEVRGDYANRMRAQFNNYRENLLDSVQREALGDIAKELGVPPDQLYVMNASNGIKTDYLTGKKVPGDRDISFMQKVFSDRSKDLTIDQSIGQRSVARRLWKKMHGGKEPPSIDEAMKFMKGKDVTYVNPNGDAASYVFEHNLDGYEDLPGMIGMTKNGKINKNLLANDLHNPTINAASIKHKGVEWWGPTAGDKLARAAEWEALAAKYPNGSAKAKLLERAFELRCQAVGDVCEGIRQITKQTDNIIIPRGAKRGIGNPLPSHLQDLQALGKRVGQDVSPAEFVKALKRYNLDLNSWADQVSKYVNAKYVPPPEIKVPNLFTPKAINDALDREQKKRR